MMSGLEERFPLIISHLKGKRLTTIELETLLEGNGQGCPDDLARTLNIMRRKGLIMGELSPDRRAWTWYLDDCPP